MSGKPRWTVTASRDDVIPGRLTVEYTLDDGTTWATHYPPTMTREEIETALDESWIYKSQSEEAKAERTQKGIVPKVKKEDIPTGLVNKEHRKS